MCDYDFTFFKYNIMRDGCDGFSSLIFLLYKASYAFQLLLVEIFLLIKIKNKGNLYTIPRRIILHLTQILLTLVFSFLDKGIYTLYISQPKTFISSVTVLSSPEIYLSSSTVSYPH
jgi:hypothetical protein